MCHSKFIECILMVKIRSERNNSMVWCHCEKHEFAPILWFEMLSLLLKMQRIMVECPTISHRFEVFCYYPTKSIFVRLKSLWQPMPLLPIWYALLLIFNNQTKQIIPLHRVKTNRVSLTALEMENRKWRTVHLMDLSWNAFQF